MFDSFTKKLLLLLISCTFFFSFFIYKIQNVIHFVNCLLIFNNISETNSKKNLKYIKRNRNIEIVLFAINQQINVVFSSPKNYLFKVDNLSNYSCTELQQR